MAFDHNDHYHRRLLRLVPPGAKTALDVGCGTGRFARRLAALGLEVDAVDPAEEVIEAAAPAQGVRYRHADITRMELGAGRYSYISCLASLHHVPFDTVTRLRDALAPGGVLAVLGCYPETTATDYAWSLVAVPVNAVARVATAGRGTPSPAPVRRPEMPLDEIRRQAAVLLPGATVSRLLFWRYLLAYRRP
ncbi:class I SAM-dependent methyltransferase [Nonomuraea antimicrobica]|uniref:Class I SAM-dependent methyltransferase n=1 Tax=Nonomuraea antimicrobica TaxID=561173 RepID=A0ABP7BAX4_9ACTN